MRALTIYGVPGKMTRRLAGVVIGTQGLAVFFGALVARSLASVTGLPDSGRFLLGGSLLAVLCILDAGSVLCGTLVTFESVHGISFVRRCSRFAPLRFQ